MKINFGTAQLPGLFTYGFDHSLLALPGLPTAYLERLAEANIKTIGALAELDNEELSGIIANSSSFKDYNTIIMQARAAEGSYGLPEPDYDPIITIINRAVKAGADKDTTMSVLYDLQGTKSQYSTRKIGRRKFTDDELIRAYVEFSGHGTNMANHFQVSPAVVSLHCKNLNLTLIGVRGKRRLENS